MIPGPYSICHITAKDNDDGLIYETIKHGYDTATQAYDLLQEVAEQENKNMDDLIVIRWIDKEEAANFCN